MSQTPFRKLSSSERVDRAGLLAEAYIPYLRERHPVGSVVAINLLTAEYVVGAQSPIAIYIYRNKFGEDADANMWLEPIYPRDTRHMRTKIVELETWFRQHTSNRGP